MAHIFSLRVQAARRGLFFLVGAAAIVAQVLILRFVAPSTGRGEQLIAARESTGTLPLFGHYLTANELNAIMLGPEADIVHSAFGETIEGGNWANIAVLVSRKTITDGITAVLNSESLVAGLLKDAIRISDMIRTGAKRSHGPQLLTEDVLAAFMSLDSKQRRMTRTFLMDVTVSYVVRKHFGEILDRQISILDSSPLLNIGRLLSENPVALDALLSPPDGMTYVTQTVYDDVARDLRFETDRAINGWLMEKMSSGQVKRIDTPQPAGTDESRRDSIAWAIKNRFRPNKTDG